MATLPCAARPRQQFRVSELLTRFFFLSILSVLILAGGSLSAKASTITVLAGGNLQAALNAAQPGDTVVLQAGASFTGSFTLPNKGTSTEWITIRTSTPDSALPSSEQRIAPSNSSLLPKLLSSGNGEAALQTAPGAHHY
ncbi:MAG: hypothetical protein QOJ64_568, partial [Acidobacteriota bacterium]|nr:hypothetical protein [Acidobacteriota bacterium]